MTQGSTHPPTHMTHVAGPTPRRRSLGLDRLRRTTLTSRFLLANLVILLTGGVLIGTWVGDQLERGILARTASITALYVESFIQPETEVLGTGGELSADQVRTLDSLLTGTSLGDRIVSLRIWSPDGTVAYSPDEALIGQVFPVEGGLAEALTGQVVAELTDLEALENVQERARFDHLIEMYVPIHEDGTGRIVAVAEFYQLPDELDREVADARLRTWLFVGVAVLASWLLLYGIVRGASRTIDRQRRALESQVEDLSSLLVQNAALHSRIRAAAERTTTLNERSLRRISADLHDGPAQMLSLALLRLDGADGAADPDRAAIAGAVQDALREMRGIAAGLRLPELEHSSIEETARRAVADHQRRTSAVVREELGELPSRSELPVRIALFRALQELLSNATRHGSGVITVRLDASGNVLRLDVSDEGQGFDQARVGSAEHLGLAGIREQAELLGGGFDIGRTDAGHTAVSVWWPLGGPET
ncbi:MAG: sensor histidine kinase [Candidatus Limnocylindrales bacterium]